MSQPQSTSGPQNTGYTTIWGSYDKESILAWNISKLGNYASLGPDHLNVPMTLPFGAGGYKYIVMSANHPEPTSFMSGTLEVPMEKPLLLFIDKTMYRVYRSSSQIATNIKITINN